MALRIERILSGPLPASGRALIPQMGDGSIGRDVSVPRTDGLDLARNSYGTVMFVDCRITYDLRSDDGSLDLWTVFDIKSGRPALVNGVRQVGLAFAEADALVDVLNAMERAAPGSSVTW